MALVGSIMQSPPSLAQPALSSSSLSREKMYQGSTNTRSLLWLMLILGAVRNLDCFCNRVIIIIIMIIRIGFDFNLDVSTRNTVSFTNACVRVMVSRRYGGFCNNRIKNMV
jgi:hypothetical protein